MYCYQMSQYIRLNSKNNSFRGNYSRKYGRLKVKFVQRKILTIIFNQITSINLSAVCFFPTIRRKACVKRKLIFIPLNTPKDAVSPFFVAYKGQLILECIFDVLNFPKKQRKNLTNFYPRI